MEFVADGDTVNYVNVPHASSTWNDENAEDGPTFFFGWQLAEVINEMIAVKPRQDFPVNSKEPEK